MKNIIIKWFMAINILFLKLSRGMIGSRLGKQTILILHTTGRKSGQDHAIPIAYFNYKGSYFIVASNWGKDRQADWYLNLKRDARARVEVNGKAFSVLGREARGDEYDRLWKFATDHHPPYLEYQKMTLRHIPIVLFEQSG